jgi:hypothetical protein
MACYYSFSSPQVSILNQILQASWHPGFTTVNTDSVKYFNLHSYNIQVQQTPNYPCADHPVWRLFMGNFSYINTDTCELGFQYISMPCSSFRGFGFGRYTEDMVEQYL